MSKLVIGEAIILKSQDLDLDLSSCNSKTFSIVNEVNSESSLSLVNIDGIDQIDVEIKKDSKLRLSILFENDISDLKINIKVKNNAVLEGFFGDFSKNYLNLDCVVDLEEENANTYIKLASLSAEKDDKNISVSINHLVGKTYGRVDNFGICKDSGRLLFAGTSHIFESAIKSKTLQNAKIMVFDESSNAIAKPILKIDENDIEASHGAVVGKINDEHLFYLTSRGISEAEAKQLITYGYLKPILLGFNNEQTKEHISSLIERRM